VEGADAIGIEDAALLELGVRGVECMGAVPAEFRPIGGATGARLGLFETRARSSFLRALRLRVWWFRSCLVVYWSDKGGQRWRDGLKADLRRLAHAARIARHGALGDGSLVDHLSDDGTTCADSMRQTAKRLRDRIAQGDRLQTTNPTASELHLKLWRRGRAWERRPFHAEFPDAPHISQASTLAAATAGHWSHRSRFDAPEPSAWVRTVYAARLLACGNADASRLDWLATVRAALAAQGQRHESAHRADYVGFWMSTLAARDDDESQAARDDRAQRFAAVRAARLAVHALKVARDLACIEARQRLEGDDDGAETTARLRAQYRRDAFERATGAELGSPLSTAIETARAATRARRAACARRAGYAGQRADRWRAFCHARRIVARASSLGVKVDAATVARWARRAVARGQWTRRTVARLAAAMLRAAH
jgi:hypothetical protein